MKTEFIPYEQALALKELGFDELCFGVYSEYDKTRVYDESAIREGLTIPAPLYQQAFKFFRENGIDYSIVPMRVDGWNEYQYVIFTLDEIVETSFNSYEEAEQACLDKLIEIVKNK